MMALKERCYERLRTGNHSAKVTQRIRAQQMRTSSWPPTFNFFHCTIRRSGQNNLGPRLSCAPFPLGKESVGLRACVHWRPCPSRSCSLKYLGP